MEVTCLRGDGIEGKMKKEPFILLWGVRGHSLCRVRNAIIHGRENSLPYPNGIVLDVLVTECKMDFAELPAFCHCLLTSHSTSSSVCLFQPMLS